jgi:hypothetical protein
LEDKAVDGKITLTWIFKKNMIPVCGMDSSS